MAIVTFERTAKGCIPIHGCFTNEEAETHAAMAVAANELDNKYSSDNFTEIDGSRVPKEIDRKCIAGPFVLDRGSIWITGGCAANEVAFVHFEATQNCVYFANDLDFDTASLQAHLAAITDDVEQSISVDNSVPNRWAILAPVGIPQIVLAECFAKHSGLAATQNAYVGNHEADRDLIAFG